MFLVIFGCSTLLNTATYSVALYNFKYYSNTNVINVFDGYKLI